MSKLPRLLKTLRLALQATTPGEQAAAINSATTMISRHQPLLQSVVDALEKSTGQDQSNANSWRLETRNSFLETEMIRITADIERYKTENRRLRFENRSLNRSLKDHLAPPMFPLPGLSAQKWWNEVSTDVNPPVFNASAFAALPGSPSRSWLYSLQQQLPNLGTWQIIADTPHGRWRELRATTLPEVDSFLRSIGINPCHIARVERPPQPRMDL